MLGVVFIRSLGGMVRLDGHGFLIGRQAEAGPRLTGPSYLAGAAVLAGEVCCHWVPDLGGSFRRTSPPAEGQEGRPTMAPGSPYTFHLLVSLLESYHHLYPVGRRRNNLEGPSRKILWALLGDTIHILWVR